MNGHELNLDSAQRQMDIREAQGEDMSLAYIDANTYEIIKLPFKVELYDKEPVEVNNIFGGGSCVLLPEAVAVYDCITGANMIGNYQMVEDGCAWFRKHYPKEYMVLLD
jgi:hypothetical protein